MMWAAKAALRLSKPRPAKAFGEKDRVKENRQGIFCIQSRSFPERFSSGNGGGSLPKRLFRQAALYFFEFFLTFSKTVI